VCRRIGSNRGARSVIVALTGWGQDEDRPEVEEKPAFNTISSSRCMTRVHPEVCSHLATVFRCDPLEVRDRDAERGNTRHVLLNTGTSAVEPNGIDALELTLSITTLTARAMVFTLHFAECPRWEGEQLWIFVTYWRRGCCMVVPAGVHVAQHDAVGMRRTLDHAGRLASCASPISAICMVPGPEASDVGPGIGLRTNTCWSTHTRSSVRLNPGP
jgi:hypothetical protein